jgi:tRNA uridine 5-carbamoylmethylation protein Kti12
MTLYILCGAPGSGKSYFAEHYLLKNETIYYVSRDKIRYSMIKEEDEYFSKETEVFNAFIWEIKNLLDSKTIPCSGVVVDATHLNWASRRKLLRALGILDGKYSNIDIIVVYVRPNLNTVLARNNSRTGRARVPEDAVRRMYNSQTSPWDDPFEYTAVMEVRA